MRTVLLWVALGMAGLIATGGATYATSRLSDQEVGQPSAPPLAGSDLAPRPVPTTSAAPTTSGTTSTTGTTTATTPSTTTTPVAPTGSRPTTTGGEESDDDDGRGRGGDEDRDEDDD